MKIVINDPIKYVETFYPGITSEEWDECQGNLEEFEAELILHGIRFISNLSETDYYITILKQRIVLDEIKMNNVLCSLYYFFENLHIKFVESAGPEAEFSFRLFQGDRV